LARGRDTRRARALRHAELLAEYGRRSDQDLAALLEAVGQRLREMRGAAAEAKAIGTQVDAARQELRAAEGRLNLAQEAGWGFMRLRRDPTAAARQSEADAAVSAARQALASLHARKEAVERIARDRYAGEARHLGDIAAALRAIRQTRRKDIERARLNALEGRARSGARKHRNADAIPDACPYCNRTLTEPQHDHIVPVARGGLSEPTNLVFVCRPCNQTKKDMTLLQFCRKNNFDFHEVVSRLEAIGKVV
jgi:5-methylcytosine-specific restriction endonuclease McrA